MNIDYYLGLGYDINSINGVNCWTLFRLVRAREQGKGTPSFTAISSSLRGISEAFESAIEKNQHGFKQVETPGDYDLVLMTRSRKSTREFHCGVWYQGKILHAKGVGLSGSVWLDEPSEFNDYKLEYWSDVE